MKAKKLVPIDADLAGRAAAAGKKSGRGYYATVNDMLRSALDAPPVPGDGETAKQILRDMLRQFPGFITDDDDVNGGDLVDYVGGCMPNIERAIGGPVTVQELSVCRDCLEVVKYGDDNSNGLDADRSGEIAVAIRALLEKHPGATLHAGIIVTLRSWSACELCGSKLHGARHAVTLFKA